MPQRKRKEVRLGKWRPKAVPYTASDPKLAAMVLPMRYLALEDPYFSGTWRVEPVDYTGRGIVYFFHTEEEARDWAKHKNKEFTQLSTWAAAKRRK